MKTQYIIILLVSLACSHGGTQAHNAGVRRSFNTNDTTTQAVWEQDPRSHHKGDTSMQTHPAVRVGFELATDGIQFYYIFANYDKTSLILVSFSHDDTQPASCKIWQKMKVH